LIIGYLDLSRIKEIKRRLLEDLDSLQDDIDALKDSGVLSPFETKIVIHF